MNNLSSQFRARLAFALGSSAGKTGRCRGRITIAVCVAVALFPAKPISGLDQNGDGMSDVWQQHYSVPSSDANLDYNGTGLTNTQKSLLALDPHDPSSRFRLDIVTDAANSQLRLQLSTAYGKLYQIQSSTDLRSWIALNSPITGTGQTAQITLPLPQPPIFFRASYAGDIDADGDGLTAWEENLLGTDDNNADSDNDGMPDAWEYSHGSNPILNDANNDLDGDGATNLQEYQAGTDPNDYYNGQAPTLTIVSGDGQSGSINSFLGNPLVIKITDPQNEALANAPVTFSVPIGSGELSTATIGTPLSSTITLRTSNDGSAAIYFKLSSNPPSDISITATAGAATVTLTAHYVPFPPLSIISGNEQQGLPSNFLPAPLVVRLVDTAGQPIVNAPVTFTVTSGDGQLTVRPFDTNVSASLTITTNNEGLAWLYYIHGPNTNVTNSITAAWNVATSSMKSAGSNSQVTFSTTTSIPPVAAKSIAVGRGHALALYADGTVWSWGDNAQGQLGDGTTTSRWRRAEVLNLTNVVAVSTHGETSAALRTDGAVWTWGSNYYRTLGNGTAVSRSTVPVQVLQNQTTPLTGVVGISSGYSHQLALKSDGTVWAWGANWAYQLGNSSGTESAFALPILMGDGSSLHDVVSIACGDDYNLALKSDGTVWAWGYNSDRELGTGDTNWARATPAPVVGLTNVIAVAGGAYHSLALKSDGTVWSWGRNSQGCLGNGIATGTQATPAPVANIDHVIAIAPARTHSLALKSDGTVWSWGDNSAGQLGVSTSPDRSLAPVQTQNLSAIIAIAAAEFQSIALTVNASLFGWGANDSGQLGNPPLTSETLPTIVRDFLLIEDPDHDGLITWKELKLGGNPNAYSTANDTISDSWKASYNLSLTDLNLATTDLTGKGLTILQDYQLGTNPTKFSTVDDGIADGWKVHYQLNALDSSLADKDPSGKGWTVRMDYQLGTDPTKISTLSDGIPDKWKVDHHANPLDSRYATGDADQDGLSNAQEYTAGTDPENPDTDSDGFFDGPDGWATDADLHPPRLPDYQYAVVDLGDGAARAINNQNQVIGDNQQGFFWENGLRQDFPANGGRTDYAVGINDNGIALFNHNDGPPTLRRPDGTEISLQFTSADGRFDFDPNIVYSSVTSFGGAGISNSGYVAGAFNWLGSWGPAYGGSAGVPRAAIWTTNYSSPILLDTVPDANDRMLTVDDTQRHDFAKDYENTVDSFNFGGRYDNRRGLDSRVFGISMNNSGQIVANTLNQDSVDAWGFPFYGPQFQIITLWTDNQPEIVAQASSSALQAFAINDDSIIVGINRIGHKGLWVKINGTWKEKDLGLWGDSYSGMWINQNLQIAQGHLLYQNQHLIDLRTHIPQTYMNIQALGINEAGLIVGQADVQTDLYQVRQHAVLLLPADLMVDYNRDGKIDDKDRGQITTDNPYRFWINDDNDEGDTGGDGVPRYKEDGTGVGNGVDESVNGNRDLIDFFPMFLNIKNLVKLLPTDDYEYVLQNEDRHLNFIYTDLSPADSGSYLRTSGSFGAAQVTHISEGGSPLAEGFLNSIVTDGKGVLLFEAGLEVASPLTLEVRSKSSGEKVASLSLPLRIKSVERMYRHYNLLFAGGVFGGHPTDLNTPNNYPDELCTAKNLVFVHGYNVNPDEARGWNAKMFKSMWWAGSRAKFYGVTWHGSETQQEYGSISVTTNYHLNVDNAFATAQPFAGFINSLNGSVTVFAHSLGNLVVASAIHDWNARIDNFYMIDPAVAIEAFDGNATKEPLMAHEDWYQAGRPATDNYQERVWASEWYQNPALASGDGRTTLTWRDRLRGVSGVRVYNFFSSGEEVLAPPDPTTPAVIGYAGGQLFNAVFGDSPCGEKSWTLQEKLKGRAITGEILGSTYGGWGFNSYWNVSTDEFGGTRRRRPAETIELTDPQLIPNPFFFPGPGNLHSDNGSSYAAQHRNTLLAEMIPARTRPAGGNEVAKFTLDAGEQRNVDLVTLENGWPQERLNNDKKQNRWLHSDANQVAYQFTWKLFERLKTLSALDQ